MLSQSPFLSNQNRRIARGAGCRPAAEPRQNLLLAALPHADYARLLEHLEFVPLPLGLALHHAGDRENYLYFVTAGVVSRFYVLASGATAGLALTGREGAIGINGFLSGEGAPVQAAVLFAGHAYRLGLGVLQRNSTQLGTLPLLLLRYTQALMTQTMLTAACNRHHSVEQQLSRQILSILDRLPSHELAVTQEILANVLGVRREAITSAISGLQEAGVIDHTRGHIMVVDRALLQARACECYSVVRREYERLLPILQ